MKKSLTIAALGLAFTLTAVGTASAQVAGSTPLGVTVTEMERVAMGWSARQSILGKTMYNESGEKIGKVEDLIIDPGKNVSYLIVGVGGFVGMGKHAVAVPASQVHDQGGRIVLTGATKQALAAMPPFRYAPVTRTQSSIAARAEHDIDMGKKKITSLEKQSEAGVGDAKDRMGRQIADIKQNQKKVEDKLEEMKGAGETKWKAVEAEVRKASAQLRNSIEKAVG